MKDEELIDLLWEVKEGKTHSRTTKQKELDMKKPVLEDFKRDVFDGQDYADWYKEYIEALEKYVDFLKDRINPNSNWISVEDRLPEEGEFILITATRNKDLITIGFLTPLTHKQWYVTARNVGIIPFGSVSHWMPLPKPPTP